MGAGSSALDDGHGERVPQDSWRRILAVALPTPSSCFRCIALGQAREALRRKSMRPPPQKKMASHTSRPVACAQRGVEITPTSEEMQFHRELRKRPAEKRLAEGPSQKKRREEEKEEEEEEEEEQLSFSSGSDSASDPRL